MKTLKNLWIYNTAYRSFDWGDISFDEKICHVQRDFSKRRGDGLYLIPGLVDIHMHIESSMTTPTEFSNAVLPHGTTTIVADCHEVANVFGVEGLHAYMDLPSQMDVFYAIPSSVPSTSSILETTGGVIDEAEVITLAKRKDIIALGEIMNANDLFVEEDSRTKRIIKAFASARPDCPIEGHCPKITGEQLSRFIASGVNSDHTQQTPASIQEKISQGMYLEIQDKSISEETISSLNNDLLSDSFCFCTDDVMPDRLFEKGHLDAVLRHALICGMKISAAIYACTYSPARRMRLFDRGQIAPGLLADFMIVDDLETFHIKAVYKKGVLVYDDQRGLINRLALLPLDKKYLNSLKRDPVANN
ncbi:MAG: amidohydrolase family protein [Sphaerochaeta sp.]|nr:amidohydrolase family protein [Sphaerochaeta sp.]